MSTTCVCLLPVTREGQKALEPLEQGYRWLLAATWVLGTEPGPLEEEQPVALNR